ncbi:Vitelline membrane outer layer protein 1-like 4 [Homarus americanus]|uniref:Vitelline membrane outer layer protein 1-like 4 n=1 Tax=Homarus americanus TaxID=6706 RepID=A0A8J5JYR8_HOMAM|nr:Vitelline membrane outer layer protein 1-like 4 [Homarus americanus]
MWATLTYHYLINTHKMNTNVLLLPLLSCCLLVAADVTKIQVERNVTTELKLNNGIAWGEWGTVELCPSGSYAHAFEVKFQSPGGTDETALNAVKLYCATETEHDVDYVTSVVGIEGHWQGMRVCSDGFLTGMRAEVLEPQGLLHDDVAVENVQVQCDYDDNEILEGVENLPMFTPGIYSEWGYCDAGSAICGLQVRYEAVSIGDDSATTDLIMFCCEE